MTTYHFIGIKGTGMSALAQILHDSGEKVQGSDVDKVFFTQEELEKKGIPIYSFSADNIKKEDIFVEIVKKLFMNIIHFLLLMNLFQ